MAHVDLIKGPQPWAILLIGIAFAMYALRKRWKQQKAKASVSQPISAREDNKEKKNSEYSKATYYHIEPLPHFNLAEEEPIKIRPFKPKYHLTMAIENTTPSDLLAMDKTYPQRIHLRRALLRDRQPDVLAHNPAIEPAVREFYAWLTNTYLPSRFPTLFTREADTDALRNHATDELLPLHVSPGAGGAEQALQLIGANIDTDFLFLLPIPPEGLSSPHAAATTTTTKYRLEGFVTCFPSGFDTRRKLNLALADIHAPVPGYGAKLERSMDRFFAALPVGRVVKRCNWSVTTNRELFALRGNHLSEEELAARAGKGKEEEVDLDECVLRCERQTLHRLPESKALVFAFKTYQYALQEIKDEGNGEALASAIEGLGQGSVPGMRVYKREVIWGKKVKAFLRGQENRN